MTTLSHARIHAPESVESGYGRWRLNPDLVGPGAMALEIAVLVATSVAAGAFYQSAVLGTRSMELQPFLAAGLLMSVLYVVLLNPHGSYRIEKLAADRVHLRRPLLTWCLAFLFFSAATFAFKIGAEFSRGSVFSFFGFGLAVIAVLRLALRRVLRRAVAQGRLESRRVAVLGDLARFEDAIASRALGAAGMRVVGTFGLEPGRAGTEDLDARARDLVAYARERQVDEILVFLPTLNDVLIRRVLERLRVLPLPVLVVPGPELCALIAQPIARFGPLCALELQRAPLSKLERGLKRAFDIAAALSALVALAPMFAAVALLVKLDSPGPVFFRQTRVGFSGRAFRIFKFRTMTTLDDGAEIRQATRGDQRVTGVGRWLRASSIDELPQLINVLMGHMSLVGPRPHALAHDDEYSKLIRTYAFRHHVKPGITGWAQVNGFRGETPTVDLMEQRVEHDLWYIANWSFWLDLRTIFRTVGELVRARNAY